MFSHRESTRSRRRREASPDAGDDASTLCSLTIGSQKSICVQAKRLASNASAVRKKSRYLECTGSGGGGGLP